jgi:hypothetical protein
MRDNVWNSCNGNPTYVEVQIPDAWVKMTLFNNSEFGQIVLGWEIWLYRTGSWGFDAYHFVVYNGPAVNPNMTGGPYNFLRGTTIVPPHVKVKNSITVTVACTKAKRHQKAAPKEKKKTSSKR